MNTKKRFSSFDFPITISRKHRYLVVSSPEFGYRVASLALDLGKLSPQAIGEAVLRTFLEVQARIDESYRESHRRGSGAGGGASLPAPSERIRWLHRESLPTRQAARALGVSVQTLRKMAAEGAIRFIRTPGGHYRFPLDALEDYLVRTSPEQPSEWKGVAS